MVRQKAWKLGQSGGRCKFDQSWGIFCVQSGQGVEAMNPPKFITCTPSIPLNPQHAQHTAVSYRPFCIWSFLPFLVYDNHWLLLRSRQSGLILRHNDLWCSVNGKLYVKNLVNATIHPNTLNCWGRCWILWLKCKRVIFTFTIITGHVCPLWMPKAAL